jgi:thiamine pyrophosphokinase
MKVVVVASGDLDPRDATWLDAADLVIAADGGADALDRLGRRPEVVVGDLDSADPALVDRFMAAGTSVERHPVDKEASDSELALEAALAAGATEIVLLGAFGGERLDHELANVLLLADPALAGPNLRLARGSSSVRLLRGGERLTMAGERGDLVTLLPIGGDATGVTTHGLRWPLDEAGMRMGRSRGLSNEVVAAPASVQVEHGMLLVVEVTREEH